MVKKILLLSSFILWAVVFSAAQHWVPLGPDGGDVRSLTRDPHSASRILLSTSAGELYESRDGGSHWARFAHLGKGNDYVLDHVIFDPSTPGRIFVAAWSVENEGGDLFVSNDDGATWSTVNDLHGKSLRAFAQSSSDPRRLVAGALDGVFASKDGGEHWAQISPPNHAEIRNIESVAIDPQNPDTIYAGTWHLPWKTTDGGATWKNIKNGMIDDSDVFSIIIDKQSPSTVYLSACSGIYKSETAGDLFHKAQGIPFSSRRTRVLRQDPTDPNVVYAGTTEGLWRTMDAGKTWKHISASNIIINDVLIEPTNTKHVLLATDRSGVLSTEDGGLTFMASNRGFSHRQVAALIEDRGSPSTLYAGVINDKEYGGVFISHDGGSSWKQTSNGLEGRDVFSLSQGTGGDLIAGTNRGIFALRHGSQQWMPINAVVNVTERTITPRVVKGKRKKKVKPIVVRKVTHSTLTARVNQLDLTADKWYAATSNGLFISDDAGHIWQGGPVNGDVELIAVRVAGNLIAAAGRKTVDISIDGGAHFMRPQLPKEISAITGIAVDGESNIYMATREGAYRTSNAGETWEYLRRLPVNNLAGINYDKSGRRLYTTSLSSTMLFESVDGGQSWKQSDAGYLVREVRPMGARILATTAFDGVVAQPDANPTTASTGAAPNGSQN